MIGLRYKEEFLDLEPGTALTWDINNLLFSDANSSQLPGSFSFPFSVPATPKNRHLLNYPERIDNAQPFIIEDEVQVYAWGKVLFTGTMKLTEATSHALKLYILVNPLNTVKETPLNELDLGGDRTFADAAAVLSHAKATATDPLSYDYVFFPIWNRNFLTDAITNQRAWFQNWYNTTTQAFSVAHDHPALMPFVRLEYILDVIFSGTAYQFENRWQINDELKKICLYNNYSLWGVEGLNTTINLQNHVSKTGAAALVRKIMGGFCLGIFYNPWDKVLRLIPIETIVNRPPKHDWTTKALHEPTVLSSASQPEILCWKREDADLAWDHYAKYMKPAAIDGEKTWSEVLAAAPGTYYVTDRHAYYLKNSIPRYFFKHQTLGCAPKETGKPAFEAECQALWDAFLYGEGQTPIDDGHYDLIPHCRITGNVEYEFDPGGGADPEIRQQQAEVPDRITIYRGMYADFDGNDYPLASGLPWDGNGNLIGQYSLRWDGQYGMYDSWWKGWHNMLRNGKNINISLRLNLADILAFNFEDKIRIRNQDYFVKKLRISLTPRGLAPVQAELVSTI